MPVAIVVPERQAGEHGDSLGAADNECVEVVDVARGVCLVAGSGVVERACAEEVAERQQGGRDEQANADYHQILVEKALDKVLETYPYDGYRDA